MAVAAAEPTDPAVAIAERLSEHRTAAAKRVDERADLLIELSQLRRQRTDLVLDEMAAGRGGASRRVDERIADLERRVGELDGVIAEDDRLEAGLRQREAEALEAARKADGVRRTKAMAQRRHRIVNTAVELRDLLADEDEDFEAARAVLAPLSMDVIGDHRLRAILAELVDELALRPDVAGVRFRPRTREERARRGPGYVVEQER